MAADRHPGITMHQLSFGGGFIGLLFAGGSVLIFVLGFPTLWYFVALALGFGILIAFLLRAIHERRSQSNRPLSILDTPSQETQAPAPDRKRTLHQIFPRLASA
ncbi:MAG TPA: hypothetical protein VGS78_11905 [Candidatus Sulfotelmatobacter sp.]|nr:hypothetical protein [Candidatus Sulfotelmatobacter sp.]